MFKRLHHQAIAQVLHALNADLLINHDCLFGGGTAIAMRFGEYRESQDMGLLVSSVGGYRELRQLSTSDLGLLFRNNTLPFEQVRELRTDQYGIRTMLRVVGRDIKLEIIREGRIMLDRPGPEDEICRVSTISILDMATGKLLANSDRWNDDGAFSRDLIDLAMMKPTKKLLEDAVSKAQTAYGNSILRDLVKAIDKVSDHNGWLEHCMEVLAIDLPKAFLWKHIRQLKKVI